MKELFEMPPPFIPANPLGDLQRLAEKQVAALAAIAGLLKETTVRVTALQAAFRAMALTHPDPKQLAAEFQDQIDYLADRVATEHAGLYQEEVQQLHQTILQAVNRKR